MSKHPKDDAILRQFAEALRTEREKQGLTQQEAAERVDIDRAAWSFLENAKRNISLITADRASRALGLSLSELLYCQEPSKKPRKG